MLREMRERRRAMDGMEFGKTVLLLGVLLVAISGIIAFVLWTRSPRYAETMAAFNDRLRMQYTGRLFRIGGSTLALGGIVLMLVAILQQEPQLYYALGLDPRTDADVVTPAEEGSRRLNELEANVQILSDGQREVSAALAKHGKSSLASKLAACRRVVRRLTRQHAVQPDFRTPSFRRPARVALDYGLSRGNLGN
ncbi:hypothetical protein HYZ80_03190 [Candidatus Parcubacteria bacterium]|nr:hypothetical protein [Candidatus Parcubacteria bacterium]